MSNKTESLWNALNLLDDLIRYGERTDHPAPPQPRTFPDRAKSGPDGADDLSDPAAAREQGDSRGRAGGGETADDPESRRRRLAEIDERIRRCTRCPLSEGRMNAVPGVGVLDPLVMVIGEGPGADEDRRGIPFVGRAGQYLDKWLDAIKISRESGAFIGNIVKCRPPGNRDPKPSESDACIPYLREQIDLIRPAAILAVGRIASGLLIGTSAGIGRLRGRTYYYNGIPLIPTYHPSGVLRNPELRRPVWEDLKRLSTLLESIADPSGDDSGNGLESDAEQPPE